MCHIHDKTNSNKLIKMDDLIKNSIKAERDHEYYGDMGIRGAKGKKNNNIRDIKNPLSTQNINYILDSENNTLIENLEQFAGQLVIRDVKSKASKSDSMKKSNDELLKFLEKKNNIEVSDSDTENNLLKSSHQEIIDENSDEEGVECVEIKTIKGTTFYLDESSNEVYETIKDENILIGKLKEVNKEYCQIKHKNKKYSIFSEIIYNDKKCLECYLTNDKFDLNLKPLK
jgi:hypothetical protein